MRVGDIICEGSVVGAIDVTVVPGDLETAMPQFPDHETPEPSMRGHNVHLPAPQGQQRGPTFRRGIGPGSKFHLPGPKGPEHFELSDIKNAVEGGVGRDRFKNELKDNPQLREKVLALMANEQGTHRQGTQAIAESMMNRATVRGTSLARAAQWASEGGYYDDRHGGQGRAWSTVRNPTSRAVLEQALDAALAGGNVSNYATDNASGGFGRGEIAQGRFLLRQYINGEYFSVPSEHEQAANARSWQEWMRNPQMGGKPEGVTSVEVDPKWHPPGKKETESTVDPKAPPVTAELPTHIMEQARHAALVGGGPGVKQFMASQGYANHGEAWCGEFAASAVTAAGGRPPRNPAVASNWRNWGVIDPEPHVGDVAIRRGARTGDTGSHVTFVDRIDPQTGMFVGLGGNQGAMRANMPISGYEFRRAGNGSEDVAAGEPVSGRAQGGPAEAPGRGYGTDYPEGGPGFGMGQTTFAGVGQPDVTPIATPYQGLEPLPVQPTFATVVPQEQRTFATVEPPAGYSGLPGTALPRDLPLRHPTGSDVDVYNAVMYATNLYSGPIGWARALYRGIGAGPAGGRVSFPRMLELPAQVPMQKPTPPIGVYEREYSRAAQIISDIMSKGGVITQHVQKPKKED